MTQNLNEEFIPKVKGSIDTLEGTVMKNIQVGIDSVVEMAQATGSAQFVKSAENFQGGSAELNKAASELVDVLTNVHEIYSKANAALN